MRTIEELKGMTQEDLVRLVQELQEKQEKLELSEKYYIKLNNKLQEKIEEYKQAVKSISKIL